MTHNERKADQRAEAQDDSLELNKETLQDLEVDGAQAGDVLKLRHETIEDNLRHAYPKMPLLARRKMAREMWEHLFLMIAEIAHFPRKVHDTNWRDYIHFKNESWMMRELFRNRPRVFVYHTWATPCGVVLLPVAVNGLLGDPAARRYRFENAFRTGQKKHKAFNPAVSITTGDHT